MTIGEFAVDIVVDAASGNLTIGELITRFGSLQVATTGEVYALVKLADKLAGVAEQAIATTLAFELFEATTGLSSQELQRWQIIAEQAGVSASAVAASVSSLQKNLASIRLGQGNVAPFSILGVNPTQGAFGVLTQLRERLRGVNPAMASNLVSQMGLDPSMLQVLRLSNVEFERFLRTARGLTEDQAHGFHKIHLALTQVHLKLKDVAVSFMFSPFFQAMLGGLTFAFERIRDVTKLVLAGFKEVPATLYLVGAALAGLAIELAPLTAGLVALLLVLDDLAAYNRGDKSIFGLIKGKGIQINESDSFKVTAAKAAGISVQSALGILRSPADMVQAIVDSADRRFREFIQTNHVVIHSTAPAHELKSAFDRKAATLSQGAIGEAANNINNGSK